MRKYSIGAKSVVYIEYFKGYFRLGQCNELGWMRFRVFYDFLIGLE